MKSLIFIVPLTGICLIVGTLLYKPKKELKIEETVIMVNNVKDISQLFVTSYYTEFTKDTIKNGKRLVLIAKGTVYAGVDLLAFDTSKVYIKKDSLGLKYCRIKMPTPKIIDAVINPSGFEIFIDEGGFSHTDMQNLKHEAVMSLKQEAMKNGLIEIAKKRISNIFSEYLVNIGFSSHTIYFE
jgi:hypothetical protein